MVRPQLIKEFHLWQLNTNALNRSYEYRKYLRRDEEVFPHSSYTMVNRTWRKACVEHADSLKVMSQDDNMKHDAIKLTLYRSNA